MFILQRSSSSLPAPTNTTPIMLLLLQHPGKKREEEEDQQTDSKEMKSCEEERMECADQSVIRSSLGQPAWADIDEIDLICG